MATLVSRSVARQAGGDNVRRSWDKKGYSFRGSYLSASAAPVVTLSTSQDAQYSAGQTCTVTFTSTNRGKWRLIASASSDVTKTYAANGLSMTIVWNIPAGQRGDSYWFGAECKNEDGQSKAYARVHVGRAAIRTVGPTSTYADMVAALSGAAAGTTFILENGTYTNTNFQVLSETPSKKPPNGVYSTYTDGSGNTRYTVSSFTVIMAQTPCGFVFDGNNTQDYFCVLVGNHGYEQECLDFDIATGAGGFSGAASGPAVCVGIKVKGVVCTNTTASPASQLAPFNSIWTRFTAFEYCGAVTKYGDSVGFNTQKTADCLMENCFETGSSRAICTTYKSLRMAIRRCMTVRQNTSTAEPLQDISLYETRNGVLQNFYGLDGKGARLFVTGSPNITFSVGMPESDFHSDGLTDFSNNWDISQTVSLNAYFGAAGSGAYENPAFANKFRFQNTIGWDSTISEYGLLVSGPLEFNGVIIGLIKNIYAGFNSPTGDGSFILNYRNSMSFQGLISHKLSVDASYNNVDTGYHFNWGPGLTTCNNSTISSFSGSINQANTTLTNTSTVRVATSSGLDNLTRITPNSELKNLGQGIVTAKDIWQCRGKIGSFWGEAGYNDWTDEDASDLMPVEKFQEFLRAYSHTGVTNLGGATSGTGGPVLTLSGNRGFATTSWDLRPYVDTYPLDGINRRPPYVHDINVSTTATTINLSLPKFKGADGNLTSYKLYVNGKLSETIPYSSNHGCTITPVSSGESYLIEISVVDSVLGESALSNPITVVVP